MTTNPSNVTRPPGFVQTADMATPDRSRANTAAAVNGLEEIRLQTRMMREHQDQITRLGVKRRNKILKLREMGVTYRRIAEAMGTTEQAVYKVVRGDL